MKGNNMKPNYSEWKMKGIFKEFNLKWNRMRGKWNERKIIGNKWKMKGNNGKWAENRRKMKGKIRREWKRYERGWI